MDKKIKTKWLKALRSGKYKQGKGALCLVNNRGNKKYCCLGVLADLYAKEHGVKWEEGIDYQGKKFEMLNGEDMVTPTKVQAWAGLKQDVPNVDHNGKEYSLAELNDGKGYGFKRIASIIEREL